MATFKINATTQLKDTTLQQFIDSELAEDLTLVPGLGGDKGANRHALQRNGVGTAHALLGQFLLLRSSPHMTPQQHADAFAQWLSGIGIAAQRNVIVLAIGCKANVLFAGMFDTDRLEREAA